MSVGAGFHKRVEDIIMAKYVTKQYYYLWIVVSICAMLDLSEVGRRFTQGSALVQASSIIGDENGKSYIYSFFIADTFTKRK